MKFALVNGIRSEAQPKLKGKCPVCGNETISKCGSMVVHHWAHSKSNDCDRWSDGETQWHRDWKDQFPSGWQEVIHDRSSGKKHRADITNIHGWVIEVQHSYLKEWEIKDRSEFYKKIIWIIDGLKPKNGKEQFATFFKHGKNFSINPRTCLAGKSVPSVVKKWLATEEYVLVDIGDESPLFLIQKSYHGPFIIEVPRDYFINAVLDKCADGIADMKSQIKKHIDNLNNVKNVPKYAFLANTPHFKFNSDGTIVWT